MGSVMNLAFWCGCGRAQVNRNGVCPRCARRHKLSRERFGGLREAVLARDGYRARCCGARDDLLVHHRSYDRQRLRDLVTLCRRCHARIHGTLRPPFAFPGELLELWREQHPGLAEQMRLQLTPGFSTQIEARQAALFERAA